MEQWEFSKNDAKPFIFPRIPKKTLFLRYDVFLIKIFTVFPTLRQLLTHQKRVLETCTFKICIEIFCFSLFSNSKWRLDVWNFLKLRILIRFRIFQVTSLCDHTNELLRVLSHRLWLVEAILAHKIKIQDVGCHEASRNTYISSFITNQDGVKFSNYQFHRF